jgi:hypothetical protein
MTDHPYAGGEVLTPGETARDDPFDEQRFCPDCSEQVEPVPGTDKCPKCGTEVA